MIFGGALVGGCCGRVWRCVVCGCEVLGKEVMVAWWREIGLGGWLVLMRYIWRVWVVILCL